MGRVISFCVLYPFAAWNNGKWLFNLYNIEYEWGISCIGLAADLDRGFDQRRELGYGGEEEGEVVDIMFGCLRWCFFD